MEVRVDGGMNGEGREGSSVSLPSFRRRLHDLHRAPPPPLLGFLPNWASDDTHSFIPTTASSFSLDSPDCLVAGLDPPRAALFFSVKWTPDALMWSQSRHLNRPIAAVFCAPDGCDHCDCFGGPFRVVFLFEDDTEEEEERSYPIQNLSELTSLHTKFFMEVTENSCFLIGRSLYFMATKSILEYDLEGHAMTVFSPPDNCDNQRLNLMLTEHGGLGAIVQDFCTCLKLWTREASDGTDARWVLSRLLDLRYFLQVMGFTEGANIIFVNSEVARVFTIELQSEKVRKACDDSVFDRLVPLVSLYTLCPKLRHNHRCQASGSVLRGSCSLCASMFDKYGCAYKAQEVNNSLDYVHKSAPNEELMKGTTREDDVGDSKTSGSSVEDAAPSLEKGRTFHQSSHSALSVRYLSSLQLGSMVIFHGIVV
ncbi:hypothetical protein ZWY2020_032734 [Hordeum vulgare]|nr:hypothetical protein ZWY2020_032734 [Hordeum vulgare]